MTTPPTTDNPDRVRPHQALRPLWICRACGEPWPCATARLDLNREYAQDRIGLCVYLAAVLSSAMDDLYRLNPHDAPEPPALFQRFLGWARIRRSGEDSSREL